MSCLKFGINLSSFVRISCLPQHYVRTASVRGIDLQFLRFDQRRNFAFPSKLPVKYVRKEKIPGEKDSGDNEGIPEYDIKGPKLLFDESKELKTANEDVKKIFSLEFASHAELKRKIDDVLIKRVCRHPYDDNSEEARIAKMTASIKNLQRHLEIKPKHTRLKTVTVNIIQRRRKLLKLMRLIDYDRFCFLIKELKLTFTPPNELTEQITRKKELTRLTKEYCEKIKHDRIKEYVAELEVYRQSFLEEKRKTLEWIEKEEKELGLTSD